MQANINNGTYTWDLDFIGTPVVNGNKRVPIVADFFTIASNTKQPEAAYKLAKWMGFGKDGYLKRIELSKTIEGISQVNFAPLQNDADLLDAYFELYPAFTGLRAIVEAGNVVVEPPKFLPGYIQAHESHGDIIIWPLRTLGIYLKATRDLSILNEQVPYMSKKDNAFVWPEKTLLDHIVSTLDCIEASYIPNTHLPRYGGGDWDDTLQPANHDLTSKMVSGWTIALLYDALNTLAIELSDLPLSKRLNQMKEDMQKDYETYMVKAGVPAGFIVFNDNGSIDYLLHPSDQQTGLKYRLLALKRPIISEMIDKSQATSYKDLIVKELKHPDGVRLMDTAVTYRGGLKTYFSRAETAANFGREIGIQYCHAHIRFIEAMAKLGEPNLAFEALYTINPIDIQKSVPNANYRQSNVYFSSSDAAFKDRYEAKRDFEKVRKGLIPVKAGWRMYSSGPGIYLNQMVSNVLGFKQYHQGLWIDPALPSELDGLQLHYHMGPYPLEVSYQFGAAEQVKINHQTVHSTPMHNRYRHAGVWIEAGLLKANQVNHIEVTLKK